jgi:hypothetical protein
MTIRLHRVALAALAVAALVLPAPVMDARAAEPPDQFERVATFVVCENTSCDRDQVPLTAAEIVAVDEDGRYLIYTDSPHEVVGFVDIKDPARPKALGVLPLDGEPTSVAVAQEWAIVAVNTSASFTSPSGHLEIFELKKCAKNPAGCTRRTRIPLAGQPDSVAVSPDGRFAAIVIENERDEDVEVDGVEGGLPQLPGGALHVLRIDGAPHKWTLRTVDLRGLSGLRAPGPRARVREHQRAQHRRRDAPGEQPHRPGGPATTSVIRDFPAGTVDLPRVDADDDGRLDPIHSLTGLAREPDAVAWIDAGCLVTANEGDLFGGRRGFTIFTEAGQVVFDSGPGLEDLALAHGHYPDGRADNKGVEPEGATVARYGDRTFLFVGSERANFVAVYELAGRGAPRFVQLLPVGIGPEGLLAIPDRGLFVVASEEDDPLRSTISVYQQREGRASYPTVVSELRKRGPLAGVAPIGWTALSALAADRSDATRLYTAHDAFLVDSRLHVMDVSGRPARITDEIPLRRNGAPVSYDIKGLVQRANGSFWVASEGSGSGTGGNPNLLVEVAADGTVVRDIPLPPAVAALKRSNGFEGVAVTGSGATEQVYVAFQREWDGDPVRRVRVGRFTPASGEWRFFYYPLDAVESPAGGFVGLSELVALSDETLLVLERDNQGGPDARVKRLYTVSIAGLTPGLQGQPFPLLTKTLARDLVPASPRRASWGSDLSGRRSRRPAGRPRVRLRRACCGASRSGPGFRST